jgi:hypothetical protein
MEGPPYIAVVGLPFHRQEDNATGLFHAVAMYCMEL